MKTSRFLCRCTPLLAGAALMLAAGCSTLQDGACAGAEAGSQRTGPSPLLPPPPPPDTNGPHPIYIINDPVNPPDPPNPLAGVKPGLIVNLQAPTGPHKGDVLDVTDSYEVEAAAGSQIRTNGPHPAVIQINLPPEAASASRALESAKDPVGPRRVVVIMGGKNTVTPKAGRRTIVVHISLPLQYDAKCPPTPSPTPTTAVASATSRPQSSTR